MILASPERPVVSTRYSPVSIVMPSIDGERILPAALHRKSHAKALPRLPIGRFRRDASIGETRNGCTKHSKIGAQGRSSDQIRRRRDGNARLDHFGLTVKDIDAVAAEIRAKGVEFTKEPTTVRPGVRICFIRGPQGISIELLERDKKYA